MAAEFTKILKGKNGAAISRLFDLLGFEPRGRVFIKPNLSAREHTRRSENTDPAFLAALVGILLENDCMITIGHMSNLGTKDMSFPFEEVIRVAGLEFLKKGKGAQLLNLDDLPTETRARGETAFQVTTAVSGCDIYINLAKLKTHMQTGVSLSLKNQMGLLPDHGRQALHRGAHLEANIAHLGKVVRPTISIIEGVVAMEGNGPHHGSDKRTDIVFAGDDMVELDSLATAVMGFDYKTVEHIVVAERIGAGKFASAAKLKEAEIDNLRMRPAERSMRLGTSLYVWPTDACPGCLKALEEAGKKLKKDPRTALGFLLKCFVGRTNLVLGNFHHRSADEMRGRVIGFGRCAKEFCRKGGFPHMDGCPLSSEEIKDFLRRELK